MKSATLGAPLAVSALGVVASTAQMSSSRRSRISRCFLSRMTQQRLDNAQIAGAPVDQHGLRASPGVRAELRRVEARPWPTTPELVDRPSALSVRRYYHDLQTGADSVCVRPGAGSGRSLAGLICQFELDGAARVFLADGRSVHRIAARGHRFVAIESEILISILRHRLGALSKPDQLRRTDMLANLLERRNDIRDAPRYPAGGHSKACQPHAERPGKLLPYLSRIRPASALDPRSERGRR